MYFSRLFLLVWEFFTWKIVIMQERTKFITIREWTSSELRKISDIDYQELFPYISSSVNIWNISDDESDEEYSSSNYYTGISDNLCMVVSRLWNEIEKHINTDYTVTGWILCLIHHIREDVFKNPNGKHNIQVNIVIKTLHAGWYEKE